MKKRLSALLFILGISAAFSAVAAGVDDACVKNAAIQMGQNPNPDNPQMKYSYVGKINIGTTYYPNQPYAAIWFNYENSSIGTTCSTPACDDSPYGDDQEVVSCSENNNAYIVQLNGTDGIIGATLTVNKSSTIPTPTIHVQMHVNDSGVSPASGEADFTPLANPYKK